jgi:Uma2 family endonuclease
MTIAEPIKRRWSREEYYRMAQAGIFRDQRVELIDGEVLSMAPQGSQHFTAICLAHDALERAYGTGFVVRVQGPLAVSADCEPEPDLAVVRGNLRDFATKPHPSTALLIVEVSDTSLAYDRADKASLYAAAGIADYWIVNLIERQIEVYRRPVSDPAARFGSVYADKTIISIGQRIKPLSASVEIPAADLLV